MVTWSGDGTVRAWDALTGEEKGILCNDPSMAFHGVGISADGQAIAAVGGPHESTGCEGQEDGAARCKLFMATVGSLM